MLSKKSLADKISGLLKAAPSYNPDENDIESTAKVVDFDDNEEDDNIHISNQSLSAFRKKNVNLLDEVDAKYAGKKSSRKDLFDSDDDLQPEYIDQESDSEDIDDEMEDNEEGEEGSDDDDEDENSDEEGNFKHMNETNLKVINQKSQSVQNQIRIWESLLEMRIQLQKYLVASNKLPPPEVYKEMKQDNEFLEKTNTLKQALGNTLGKMMDLQELLIKKYPESKNVLKDTPKQEKNYNEDDDEIPSDTEEENTEKEESDEDDEPPSAKKKKLSINELEDRASKLHKSYKNYRDTTIQKWNDKTQIAHGKTANTNPVLKQIEYNLADKARLIKRTQLQRSEYRILGVDKQTSENNEDVENTKDHEYNNNIYDDDDFYHQLLRELIEVKSADITDPIQLSRQWIQLQNLRSKMKRKIDTKATKGRVIRYGIHNKLVNFMAPVNNEFITDEAQTELFSSLFGKRS